jgi:hypothetical protein
MGRIGATADINAFINPNEECVVDDTGNIISNVADIFGTEKEAETNEEIPQVVVKHSEAIAALHTLRAYEEQQEDAATGLIGDLTRYEWLIHGERQKEGIRGKSVTFLGVDRQFSYK